MLFLVADTGGGHRAAAQAVAGALERLLPGGFAPILHDPLGGPAASPTLRLISGLYGPSTRFAPRAWGAIYRASDSPRAMDLVRRTVLRLADAPVADAVHRHQPAAIVSFHPLLAPAAVAASDGRVPVVTVVTDLVTAHTAWRYAPVDRLVVPSAAVRWRCHLDGLPAGRVVEIGLPVAGEFAVPTGGRAAARRALGVNDELFLVVLTGGGEGSGRIARHANAIIERFDDVGVVAICGRNRRLRRRLEDLAGRVGGRLTVAGFVDNMADWLLCADVVVSKAGPGTIAEAACCATPMLLTSRLPGQEEGNAELVAAAGAGRLTPGVPELLAEIDRLRRDPGALAAMRSAAARLARPDAAIRIAALLAEVAS